MFVNQSKQKDFFGHYRHPVVDEIEALQASSAQLRAENDEYQAKIDAMEAELAAFNRTKVITTLWASFVEDVTVESTDGKAVFAKLCGKAKPEKDTVLPGAVAKEQVHSIFRKIFFEFKKS